MSSTGIVPSVLAGEIRDRQPQNAEQQQQQANSVDEARKTVRELNDGEAGKDEEKKRTYGRTPDGTGSSFHHLSKEYSDTWQRC